MPRRDDDTSPLYGANAAGAVTETGKPPMRTPLILVLSAAVIVAFICASAPYLNVTLNEAGTDVVAVDFSGIAKPTKAVAAEQR
jgi:hypothetical protein